MVWKRFKPNSVYFKDRQEELNKAKKGLEALASIRARSIEK
jgi:hypothetical protein